MQCLDGLAWQIYTKLRQKSIRLLNMRNCANMAVDQEYIGMVFGVKYK